MSIKKLAYYLEDADITLRSDHLPLKRFLAKNTLNLKVNNWAIEISLFRITFEYIKGIKNTLADTMSRLIEVDPKTQQESEPEGYEFGYYVFDSLPAIEVATINTTKDASINDENKGLTEFLHLPLPDKTLQWLQLQDAFCSHIITQIKKGYIKDGQLYILHDNILKKKCNR